jgi:cell fate regulator YaaT (PSP1 superfamily)
LQNADKVVVETARGLEFGEVVIAPREVSEASLVLPLKTVLRIGTEEDARRVEENQLKQKEAFAVCTEKIREHELPMKLIDVEYTFDNSKIIFYFTAEGRVDFRELVKNLAAIFRTRIELRQIGVRDEAKMVGGIGGCGRVLCCHAFLGDFEPVSIRMAKDQNLSLNPTKISGICGRLMCCLKYENEVYENMKNSASERPCNAAVGRCPCPRAAEGKLTEDNLAAEDDLAAEEYLAAEDLLAADKSAVRTKTSAEEPAKERETQSGDQIGNRPEPMGQEPAAELESPRENQPLKLPEKKNNSNLNQQPRNGNGSPAGAAPRVKRSNSNKDNWSPGRNRAAENRPGNRNGAKPDSGKAPELPLKPEDSRGQDPGKPQGMAKAHDSFKSNPNRKPKVQAKLPHANSREGQKPKADSIAEGRAGANEGRPFPKKNPSRNQRTPDQLSRKPLPNRREGTRPGSDNRETGAEKTADPRLEPVKAVRVMTAGARKNNAHTTGGQGGAHFPGDLGD